MANRARARSPRHDAPVPVERCRVRASSPTLVRFARECEAGLRTGATPPSKASANGRAAGTAGPAAAPADTRRVGSSSVAPDFRSLSKADAVARERAGSPGVRSCPATRFAFDSPAAIRWGRRHRRPNMRLRGEGRGLDRRRGEIRPSRWLALHRAGPPAGSGTRVAWFDPAVARKQVSVSRHRRSGGVPLVGRRSRPRRAARRARAGDAPPCLRRTT